MATSTADPTTLRGVASFMLCIGVAGLNFVVIIVFLKRKSLRTPVNFVLVSLASSDLLVSVTGTLVGAVVTIQLRLMDSNPGLCQWYAFITFTGGR